MKDCCKPTLKRTNKIITTTISILHNYYNCEIKTDHFIISLLLPSFKLNRQRIISYLLLFTFAIVFAHSVIPHHEKDDDLLCTEHQANPDQHKDIDNSFLGSAFANFQHEQGRAIVYEHSGLDYQFSKDSKTNKSVLLLTYLLNQFYQSPPQYHIQQNENFSSAIIVSQQQFRGPPSVFFMA